MIISDYKSQWKKEVNGLANGSYNRNNSRIIPSFNNLPDNLETKKKVINLILLFFLITIFSLKLVFASGVGLIESQQWQQNLTSVRFSTTAFGDIDNDGDLDLVLIGCLSAGADRCDSGVISKIYINNGTSLVESNQWQQNLSAVGHGTLAFGDIDNDGDLDLALSGCTNAGDTACNGNYISKIYINNGTILTESQQWQQNLTGIFDGSIAFGDIDNDGDLDLALSGARTIAPFYISKIYINNGTSLVEGNQWQGNLSGVYQGQLAFGDIDNDGDLDLALSGDTGSSYISKIYINNGTSLVENIIWEQNLVSLDLSSVLFGDYDNDGDLDLVWTGVSASDLIYIYKNNATTFLINQTRNMILNGLIGIYRTSSAFGDYDNDGDLDLVSIGNEHGYARIYENNESNYYYFVQDSIAHANISDDLYQGSLSWADLDNDVDLDLIINGLDFVTTLISKVYISNASLIRNNTKPAPPNFSFTSSYVNNILTLSWGNGSDIETNTSGLYYNLMVGNSTKNNSIVSGVYGGSSGGGGGVGGGSAGYFGNMMQRKSITLNVQLEANKTYYWYVQTIDTGLVKSNWSAVQSITTGLDVTKPNITINYPSPNASLHTTNPVFIFNATVTDANLTNVTLNANWTGSWHINQSNSSGINGTYTFNANLTNYADGHYAWYTGANDSSNNSETSPIRDFYLDRAYPLVYLVSPSNSATWTSSSTVTFSYNVTDVDIANCSLIIDNVIDQTDTTITEDTTQSFTKTLSNGNYNWNVNCTDYVGYTNSSSIYSLTVNYVAPSTSTSGGGGGGGGTTEKKAEVSPQKFDIDFSKTSNGSFETKQGDVKTFTFNSEIKHSIILITVTSDSITLLITSDPITIQIKLGETKQIDLNEDDINDFEINLISIISGKAKFSLTKLEGADIVAEEELEEEIKKEALFDVKVSLSNLFNVVKTGREVIAKIEVFNVNNIGQVDVVIDYYIISKEDNQTRLAEGSDTLAVEAVASFVRSLRVPYNLKSGNYLFNVDVKYNDKIMASSRTEFRVIRNYEVIIAIGVIILIVIAIFVYLWRIKRREEKLEKKERGLEKIVRELKEKKQKTRRKKKWQK